MVVLAEVKIRPLNNLDLKSLIMEWHCNKWFIYSDYGQLLERLCLLC